MLSTTAPYCPVLAEAVNNKASKEKQTLHIDQVIAEINQKKPMSVTLKQQTLLMSVKTGRQRN
ncbi:hypothetical protein [Brevibacillus halotolerans]|uniref:hypothetical protein n=1 Tax=Brevibacillus halotolerans TaxID=1507437 RepID=UPI0015EEF3D3|nr:hypothetical protein [Brevibacillus halotolerans]MBA4531120.1 hypothetical protein [Brevibacillus halotolerans]